ncbi:exocyst complex component 3-like isoform X1 [Tachysurus vachellii]|uniref:exocyst complex component 3-like isoform X1 n=2 Tax=Tachysurus vachellii TaxID=175792 RepID=UPI00296B3F25|nr:exocyst complex component 3-like isoform X1 [Tachysurus vachellii]
MDATKTVADSDTNKDNIAACSKEHIGPDGDTGTVVIVEDTKKSKGSSAMGLLTRKLKTKMGKTTSSKSDQVGVSEEPSAVANITEINTMDATKTVADSDINKDNIAACSKEHIGPDGDTGTEVIVEDTKKSKGGSAMGLLTHNLKTKIGKTTSSKSDQVNKGTGDDSSSIVMVEGTQKSPKHSSRYILHQILKKTGKKHSSKPSSKHDGTAGDSISMVIVEQPSKSLSSSAKQFLNLTLKTKMSAQKHSSNTNPDLLDFNQKLEQGFLAEANQQLLDREKSLFISQSSSEEAICTEDAKNDLKKDYETLMEHLKKAVHDSFNVDNQEMLRSAIKAIVKQEEEDKLWEEASEEAPSWRPMRCHDTIVKEVVENRLQQKNEDDSDADMLKIEVVRISSIIQNDLLQVIKHVQRCYSECFSDFNACNMYAQLYHQAFLTILRKLLRCSVTMEDYRFILQQISSYSKDILKHDELNPHINTESLGDLLPEEDYKALEDQYLSHKENETKTWLSNALELKEADWQANKKPELIDEYYICHLVLDAIGIVDGGVKEVEITLGKEKAKRILLQMGTFLMSYKNSMEEFLKTQQMDMTEIVKSQLYNIDKIRDYIEKQDDLPDEVKVAWLSTVLKLRESCHSYLLTPIHKELTATYRKLWTPAWFSEHEAIIDRLEDTLNEKIHSLNGLNCECQKELLSQLHFELMIEYVRRMLKRKLKLKNKDKQEAAARFLCQDSERIKTLFEQHGSAKEWLSEILPRVSEVIKVQDPETLVLEICALLKQHPDLSERQVVQLLQLKSRCPDVHMVRECYHQTLNNLEVSESNPAFFCHVPRNISMSFCSCFCMLPFYLTEACTCSK